VSYEAKFIRPFPHSLWERAKQKISQHCRTRISYKYGHTFGGCSSLHSSEEDLIAKTNNLNKNSLNSINIPSKMKASFFVLLFALFVCLSIAAPIPPANTPSGNFKVVAPASGTYKKWSQQSVSWVVDWNEQGAYSKQVHVAIVGQNGFWKYVGKVIYQISYTSLYTDFITFLNVS